MKSTKDHPSCAECDQKITGRMDKRFCSDQCRNAFNNKLNRDANNYVRQINRKLKKNRRVLEELNPKGTSKIHRKKLVERGFDFNFFTSLYTTKKGTVYYFCYEFGYLPLEDDYYALVVKD